MNLQVVAEGWDSLVLDVGGEWIVRIPRRDEVRDAMQVEARLLPELDLPVPIPRFEVVTEVAVAYRRLRGTPIDASRPALGRQVGRFLAALHAFPVERARELGVPDHAYRAFTEEVLDRAGPLLAGDVERARGMLDEHFAAEASVTPRLLHADLGPAHLLAEAEELTGVIDWGDLRIGDPALDFAWVLQQPFAEDVLAAYGEHDPGLRERALFFHRLGPWYELHYGLFFDRPEFVESGLAGVRSRLPARLT